jgi:hypothetical protein
LDGVNELNILETNITTPALSQIFELCLASKKNQLDLISTENSVGQEELLSRDVNALFAQFETSIADSSYYKGSTEELIPVINNVNAYDEYFDKAYENQQIQHAQQDKHFQANLTNEKIVYAKPSSTSVKPVPVHIEHQETSAVFVEGGPPPTKKQKLNPTSTINVAAVKYTTKITPVGALCSMSIELPKNIDYLITTVHQNRQCTTTINPLGTLKFRRDHDLCCREKEVESQCSESISLLKYL